MPNNERIEELETRVEELEAQLEDDDNSETSQGVSRRTVLGSMAASAAAGAAGVFSLSGPATAQTAPGYTTTGELRDGNGNVHALLNNGGPFAFQQPVTAPSLDVSNGDINNATVLFDTRTVPDDSSIQLTNSSKFSDRDILGIIIVNGVNNSRMAVVAAGYRGLGDLTSYQIVVDTSNTQYTGTTGADGDVTLGRYFGETRLENRSGSALDFGITVLGRVI